MRKTKVAVVISSLLLGAAVAQADPTTEPSQSREVQGTPQSETSRSTSPPASPGPGNAAGGDESAGAGQNADSGQGNVDVGSPRSNVDEKSSSGSYYPYSAGTAGDDPAEPTSTSVDTGELARAGATSNDDQWTAADSDGDGYLSQDELKNVAPTFAASIAEMDVDKDEKVSRDEFRTWDESRKASMEADKAPDSGFSSSRDSDTPVTDDSTSGSPAPGTDKN